MRRAKHKFHAVQTALDGIKFPSKLEARYYQQLKLRQRAGDVVFFLRQTPLHLPGGTKLVIDFLVFNADGTVSFIDVKGMQTPAFKMKKKEIEHHYPITIEVVKK